MNEFLNDFKELGNLAMEKKRNCKSPLLQCSLIRALQKFAQGPGQRSPERHPEGQVGLISGTLEVEVIFQAEKAVPTKVRRSERIQNTVERTWDR